MPDSQQPAAPDAALKSSASEAASPRRVLIVNADDLGWSRSVNAGIFEAARTGIVTRASLLATADDFEHAVGLAAAQPDLALGVHLEFYRGQPLLPADRVRSLIGEDGLFLGSSSEIIRRLASGAFDAGELEAEFRAQIDRVLQTGIRPTHLNSEKHLHLWPSVFDIVAKLALEFDIPYVRVVREPFSLKPIPLGLSALSVRNARIARARGIATPDGTIGVAESPSDVAALTRLLTAGRGRVVELVAHPGHLDDEFWKLQDRLPNKLTHEREAQLGVLADAGAAELVRKAGFVLEPREDRT